MQKLISGLNEADNKISLRANHPNMAQRTASVTFKGDRSSGRNYHVVLHSAWADRQQRLNGINQVQAIEAIQAHLGADAIQGASYV